MPIPIIIALIALLSGGGTIGASQNSLPGDALFPLKTMTEDARVFFAQGENENELRLELAAERVKEINEISKSANENENESVEARRLRGLDDAIENIDNHLSGVASRAQQMRERGESGRAIELLEDLKANSGILSQVMELERERASRQELKEKIELALEKVDDVRVRIEKEVGDIQEIEKSGSDNLQSSSGKINAAENKVAEVERKFDRRKDNLSEDNKIEVEKKITEAQNLIDSAKSDSDSSKFDDAFEKAHEAIRTASLANALISRDNEIRIMNRSIDNLVNDIRREDRSFESGVEISTDPGANNSVEVKAEVRFITNSNNINAIAQEVINRLKLDRTAISNVLKMSNEGLEELREKIEGRIRTRDGANEVRFEFRFPLSTRDRAAIISSIESRLNGLGLSTVETALQMRIENDEGLEIRVNELGEDIRGNSDENEIRGRDNEIESPGDQPRQEDRGLEIRGRENEPGEDVRGQEQELRGRANEPGEDIQGNADENEIRGRDNEIESPGDQPRQEDRSSGGSSVDDNPIISSSGGSGADDSGGGSGGSGGGSSSGGGGGGGGSSDD